METTYSQPGQDGRVFDPWFEEQFNDRERFETHGGHITVVDISPPDFCNQEDQAPVVFVPGYLANVDGFKLTMNAFAQSGKRVVGFNHSNRTGRSDHGQPFHNSIVQKADDLQTLVDILDHKGSDVVAHSRVFIVSMLACKLHADTSGGTFPFRRVLGVAPAGLKQLDYQDALRGPGMITRGAREMLAHPNRKRIAISTIKFLAKNMLKIPGEGLALYGTEVAGIVNELSDEIDIGVLLEPNDEVISANKLYPLFEQRSIRVSTIATVVSKNSGHAGLLNNTITMNAAVEMLDRMRNSYRIQNQ